MKILVILSMFFISACQHTVVCHDVDQFINANPTVEHDMLRYSRLFNPYPGEAAMESIGYERTQCNEYLVKMRYSYCMADTTVERWAIALYNYSGELITFQNE